MISFFIKKNSTKYEAETNAQDRKGFMTSTKSCLGSVLVKKRNKATGFVAVNNFVELSNVRNVIKRDKKETKARER